MSRHNSSWFVQAHYWVVALFVVAAGLLHGSGQLRIVGIILALVAVIRCFNRKTSLFEVGFPVELKFYLIWGVWAILTGVVVADVQFPFWFNVRILVQMMIMLFAGCSIMYFQRDTRHLWVALIIVALLNVIAVEMGYVSGGADKEVYVDEYVDITKTRATGITGNANALGFIMLYGVWASTMMYGTIRTKRHIVRMICLACVVLILAVLGRYVVYSASRKSLLTLGAMVITWAIWILPRGGGVAPLFVRMFLCAIVLIIGGAFISYVSAETVVGERFQQLFDAGGGNVVAGFKESNIRYLMYVDGLKIWFHHPIAGVGLGQFMVHFFSGQYSHSDYIEALACTGLIGAILYQGFAVAILCRLIKMLRYRLPDEDIRMVKGMIVFMLFCHFLIGFGTPHWSGQLHEFIVMFCGAWSCRVSREYQHTTRC